MAHAYSSSSRILGSGGQVDVWASDAAEAAYEASKRCLVDLYGGLGVPAYAPTRAGVDGKRTATENLADAAGLAAAWDAHTAQAAAGDRGPPAPALAAALSDDQLFFLAYAQNHCEVARPAAARLGSPHAPGWARVRGPLSQFPPFAATFSCPRGAPYNPPTRCAVSG